MSATWGHRLDSGLGVTLTQMQGMVLRRARWFSVEVKCTSPGIVLNPVVPQFTHL